MGADVIAIIVTYVLAQVADILTTNRALDEGNREANPTVKFLMDELGSAWWVAKLAGAVAAGAAMHYFGAVSAMFLTGGLTLLVAIRNWRLTR